VGRYRAKGRGEAIASWGLCVGPDCVVTLAMTGSLIVGGSHVDDEIAQVLGRPKFAGVPGRRARPGHVKL